MFGNSKVPAVAVLGQWQSLRRVFPRSVRAAFLLAIGLTVGVGETAAFAAQPHPVQAVLIESRAAVDSATCQAFIADMRADLHFFAPKERSIVLSLKDTDCYAIFEAGSSLPTAQPTLGGVSAAAAGQCRTEYRQFHLYVGGIEIATARTDMYWCWNGVIATHDPTVHYQWCRVTTMPLWFGGVDWCGSSPTSGSVIDMGQNFWVSAYSLPMWKRYGWTRFSGSATGLAGPDRGFCCN